MWIILHTIFEIIENSPEGVKFIDTRIKFWPGGKKAPDNLCNSLSDLLFTIIGYIIANKLDELYE
jgi:hypothetical protein